MAAQALEDLCCNYDWTVRNSMGEIVQFNYGIDGLDPSAMEENCVPVDFIRVMRHVKVGGGALGHSWSTCETLCDHIDYM